MEGLARELIESIVSGKVKDKDSLVKEKARLCEMYRMSTFPKNSEILQFAEEDEYDEVIALLQKKPTRTISGVAVIAAMTKPHKCPHGKCIYCPGGVDAEVPQSYTGKEPATRRAIMHNYDPYEQVHARLEQLDTIGHPIDKCELILMGGTLPSQPYVYQDYFVKGCLQAMNDYSVERHKPATTAGKAMKSVKGMRLKAMKTLALGWKRMPIAEVQRANEHAEVRCVGMTFETRPDYARRREVDFMLKMGGTRVELGVQTLRDGVYRKVERGHTVADVAISTQVMKDALLKVGYQMMPGLFADEKQDYQMFKEMIEDERFKPDLVKFYPCLVLRGTKLYDMWEKGEYEPYNTEQAVRLLAKVKKIVPPWMRVIRIQRDIPIDLVVAGVTKSNLRELVEDEMKKHGDRCRCIRCREVGLRMARDKVEPDADAIELKRIDYDASGGAETFLSFEDTTNDLLIGFLRLRKPSIGAHRKEMLCESAEWKKKKERAGGSTDAPHPPRRDGRIVCSAGIRELHVYGPMVEIGEKAQEKWQHRGYGKELLKEAERIASEEWGMDRIRVISGIGARDYYRKFGYRRVGPYMGKDLDNRK